jgi:putative ABC transport system permease protein
MGVLRAVLFRFAAFFRGRALDRELDEELQTHLDLATEENLERGLPPDEARAAALRSFGGVLRTKEDYVRQRGLPFLDVFGQDFGYALRQLANAPAFTLTAVVTLALGIGANTAVFSLLHAVLLRSLPVSHPEELARIVIADPGSDNPWNQNVGLSWQMVEELRAQQRSFTDISAWNGTAFSMRDEQGTLRLYSGALVSGNGFSVLGVRPLLGRLLVPSDDVAGGPPQGWPVVLSYGFWQDRFRGDPGVVGRAITVSDAPVTIVGVLPAGFEGVTTGFAPKMYMPIQFMAVIYGAEDLNNPLNLGFVALARLKPGVSLREAHAEIGSRRKALFEARLPPEFLTMPEVQRSVLLVKPGHNGWTFLRVQFLRPLMMLQGLVGIVLVLCCVNLAGLLLAKTYGRQHEFAVRAAIGAGRFRLFRQYLTESFLLAGLGSALGVLLAWMGSRLIVGFMTTAGAQEGISLQPDRSVLFTTGALAVVATLLFGTLPALFAARSDPGALMKSRATVGRGRGVAGRAFVPVQIGLSLLLVVAAGLFVESLKRTRTGPMGFNPEGILIVTANFQHLPAKGDAMVDLYQKMTERLEQQPGMQSAAVTWFTPMTGDSATAAFAAVGHGPEPPQDPRTAYNYVGPGYFQTLQIRRLAGREFQNSDRDQTVCILNRSAAAFFFPGEDALGQNVRNTDDRQLTKPVACRVVGVVADAKYASLKEPAPKTIYVPITKDANGLPTMVFLMRARSHADAAVAYRKVLAELAPTTPLLVFLPLAEQIDQLLGTDRLLSLLSSFFGGLALLLSGIGLYGLLATNVARRRNEIGLRMALGALRSDVVRMVLREAGSLLAVGMLLGAVATVLAGRAMPSFLYETSPADPRILLGSAALLTLVALLAAWIPAHRAAGTDPTQALRAD